MSPQVRTFDGAPTTVPLMLKAVLPALPVIGGLPGIRHRRGNEPDLVLRREGVTTDPAHLARYREVCGFAASDQLPVTYPHMAAFALHMTLMTDTAFPFAPMGLVHLRNSITQHRPIGVDETFDVSVRAADLRPHPKGHLIDLVTEVTVAHETVWTEITTLFSRGRGGGPEQSPAPLADVEPPAGTTEWRLAGNLGRRYGAVSGDRNPIHLHPLTAKAFGFSSNIAHGMWTLAHAMASLEDDVPAAHTVDVEFKKPVLLPTTVAFGSKTSRGTTTFGVHGARSKPVTHLVGRITKA